MKQALIIVDYQYDFVNPNGKLYVPGAETLKPYILTLMQAFHSKGNLVVALKDWHPTNHYSFAKWGPHTIQNTPGAELCLDEKEVDQIFCKGLDPNIDSYGGFYDEKNQSNGLDDFLKARNISNLVIVGVAENVCVEATYQQAKTLGYDVIIDQKGTKAIRSSREDFSKNKF